MRLPRRLNEWLHTYMDPPMTLAEVVKHILAFRCLILIFLAFLLPLDTLYTIEGHGSKEARCAYVILVMAILWLTEAIPIPVTALMPVFMFPMMGVLDAKTTSEQYFSDTTMLFLGGLVLAVAVEEWNLHTRIALGVMRIIGAQPALLMLGLMLPTWFLSMWISNTAATSMMIPIIQAVVGTLREVHLHDFDDLGERNLGYEMDSSSMSTVTGTSVSSHNVSSNPNSVSSRENVLQPDRRASLSTDTAEIKRLSKGFALSVAYAANVGGIATLTGTPPNLILKKQADKIYKEKSGNPGLESDISFATWMGFAFPLSLLTLVLAWGWLMVMFLRGRCAKKMDPQAKAAVNATIRRQFKALGSLTFAEGMVIAVFVLLVVLWLFRDAPNIGGWGDAFYYPVEYETIGYSKRTKQLYHRQYNFGRKTTVTPCDLGSQATTAGSVSSSYVSDSTPAVFVCVLLFILPAKLPRAFCLAEDRDKPSYTPLLTWKTVEKKIPWGVIMLLGGGFAIAEASEKSGLSDVLGNKLKVFSSYDTWVMNLVFCLVIAAATEVTSNTATATLLMPILSALGISIGVHPLYLMISATVSCSFAFMLPVATPPNAIVFSTGYLTIVDMALAGIAMNFISILCLTIAINTWGRSIFDFDTLPEFFQLTTTQSPLNVTNMTSSTTLFPLNFTNMTSS